MQIAAGLVYLCCHFFVYIETFEAQDLLQTGRSLVFDEYTGVLYPLILRACLVIQTAVGFGYYLIVYGIQLIVFALSAYYLLKRFFSGKELWLALLFVMTNPMCMHTMLMVSPLALKGAFSLIILGALIRIWKDQWNVKTFLLLLVSYVLSALNVTDDLYLWLLPFLVVLIRMVSSKKEKQDKKLIIKKLVIVGAFVLSFCVAFLILGETAEKGNRGRMQRTVSSVLFQKALWPDMGLKIGFLPEELWYCIEDKEVIASNIMAEEVIYTLGPKIDRALGYDRANEIYLEAVLKQVSYNKKALFSAVLTETAGYLLMPYSAVWFMNGQDGSAIGSLYSLMSRTYPQLTHIYWGIGMVSGFVLSFATVLKAIKNNMMAKKEKRRVLWIVTGGLLYQALWYGIANVQGVDYRYSIPVIFIFSVLMLRMFLESKPSEKEVCNKKRVLIAIGIGLVVMLSLLGILFVNAYEKGYKKDTMLSGKNIVCFGDSIWALVQDDTGIGACVEEMTGAKVTNYAISGTTASKTIGTKKENAYSYGSLMEIVEGLENDGDFGDGLGHITMESLENADYIIIAYGLNDYFNGILAMTENKNDITTYEGSLRYAVESLKAHFPKAEIVLIGQTYCQFYSYGIVADDSDTHNRGGGIGTDYVETVRNIAKEYDLLFINQYENVPMNEWDGKLYLEDATHLNEKGRVVYAKAVAEALLEDYQERNPQ